MRRLSEQMTSERNNRLQHVSDSGVSRNNFCGLNNNSAVNQTSEGEVCLQGIPRAS